MGKLVIIPLVFMIILTVLSIVGGGSISSGHVDKLSNGSMNTNGSNSTVDYMTDQDFDLSGVEGAMVILVVAVAIGIIAGIRILGSGLTTYSQSIIFNAVLYLALWAVLSIVASDLMFGTVIFTLLWFVITIMYVIGFSAQINAGMGED